MGNPQVLIVLNIPNCYGGFFGEASSVRGAVELLCLRVRVGRATIEVPSLCSCTPSYSPHPPRLTAYG